MEWGKDGLGERDRGSELEGGGLFTSSLMVWGEPAGGTGGWESVQVRWAAEWRYAASIWKVHGCVCEEAG